MLATGAIEKYFPGSLNGGVTHFDDAVERDRSEKANVYGIVNIDIVGESTGQIQVRNLGRIDTKSTHRDELPTVVGGFSLREIAGILS